MDGLSSNLQELDKITEMDKPYMICITKSKMDPSINDVTLGLRNYNIWRKDKVATENTDEHY